MPLHNAKQPDDLIKSSEHNEDLTGLSTGDFDEDSNSILLLRNSLGDYIHSGCEWDGPAGDLNSNMSGGVVIIGGVYVQVDPVTAHAFTANQDTHVFVNSSGVISYNAVSNGASSPSLPANSICLGVNVSGATGITAVWQDGRWANARSYRLYPRLFNNVDPEFSAYRSSFPYALSNGAVVIFDAEDFDNNNNYDTATGKFIAPVPGVYQFNATLSIGPDTTTHYWAASIAKNGSLFKRGAQISPANTNAQAPTISLLMQLAANDYVQIINDANATSTTNLNADSKLSWFNGFLKRALV